MDPNLLIIYNYSRSHKSPVFFEKKWSFAIYTKMSKIIKLRFQAQLSSISDFWLTVKNFRTFSHRFWFEKIKVWNFFEVQNCISRKSHVLLLDSAVQVFDLCSFWTRLWILTNFLINTLKIVLLISTDPWETKILLYVWKIRFF